jgi:hypothetical protein
MSDKYKVLMVSSAGPEETVFESQVLDMVRAWRKYGQVSLLYRSNSRIEVAVDGVEIRQVAGSLPQLSRAMLNVERTFSPQWKLSDGLDLIHCRGAMGAWQVLHGLSKKRRADVKILYDCRGIVVEEMEGTWADSWKRAFLPMKMREMRKVEEYVVNEVDMITAVSDGLSDYLEQHYGRRADQIMRPIVNTDKFAFSNAGRQTVRALLRLTDSDKLFIFVGGGAFWQSLHLLKTWWLAVRQSNTTLLILTHKPSDYGAWISEMTESSGQIIVKSVPHHEVCSYMSAADFGILFRDDGLINNVASPVKLGEYLSTGLQVLTNLTTYHDIQPLDVSVVDPSGIYGSDQFQIRNEFKREERANENRNSFSAVHAVEGLYKLAHR